MGDDQAVGYGPVHQAARRAAIIRLVETMYDGLPMPMRREHTTPGFVNEARARTCPDCLANGRVMKSCETCHGSGTVTPKHLDEISLPDSLPGDGDPRDPYAVTGSIVPYGVRETVKLGHVPERDAEIDRARALGRERPANELEAAETTTPYVWERERATMFRRYDYGALYVALELLRDRAPGCARAVVMVYAHDIIEPSSTLQAALEEGLRFIDERMPDPVRAPGMEHKHPALRRRDRRAA